MNNKKFIVYVHIFPNNKMYFGITSKFPNARWQNGFGYNKEHQPVMYNAIQKYGWKNIEHKILFEDLTFKEASQKEKELIEKYKTNCTRYGNDYGYNMTDGGEGSLGHVAGENVSRINRERMINKKGKDCCNSKPVICNGIEYESLIQFKEINGHPNGAINAWLCGKKSMPKEWFDKGLKYKDSNAIIKCQKESHQKEIYYDGKIYKSQAECSKYIGVSASVFTKWMRMESAVPKYIIDNGLRYANEESHNFITQEKEYKTKIIYDDKIYESQRELAKKLNIKPATLNAWLTGKNKIPKKYKEKGLSYIK